MQSGKKSSSGRCIKTPKHLLPTSSDDEPTSKRPAVIEEVNLEIRKEELRAILQNLQKKKGTLTSEPHMKTPTATLFQVVKGNKLSQNCKPIVTEGVNLLTEKLKADENNMPEILKIQEYPSTSFRENEIIRKGEAFDETFMKLTNLITAYHEETMRQNQFILEQNKELIEQNAELKEKINNMAMQLEEFIKSNKRSEINDSFSQHLPGFPLKTRQEFDALEGSSDERDKLFEHLKKIGASKLRDFIKMSFKEICSDHLVNEHITWNGCNNTIEFGSSITANIIFRAAKECTFFKGPETKNEFKNEVIDILRITKQRYKTQIKKSSASLSEEVTNEIEKIQAQLRSLEDSEQ